MILPPRPSANAPARSLHGAVYPRRPNPALALEPALELFNRPYDTAREEVGRRKHDLATAGPARHGEVVAVLVVVAQRFEPDASHAREMARSGPSRSRGLFRGCSLA
jgi:hypothetical protein